MPSVLKHSPKTKTKSPLLNLTDKKANTAFTSNYFIFSRGLTHEQDTFLKYAIIKLDSLNSIVINTKFIKDYKKAINLTIQDTLQCKKPRFKVAYSNVVEHIIFLIDTHVLIRLKPNSAYFIMNPCYAYPKTQLSRSSVSLKWAKIWVELNELGEIDEKKAELYALGYYREMVENRVKYMDTSRYRAGTKRLFEQGGKMYKYAVKTISNAV